MKLRFLILPTVLVLLCFSNTGIAGVSINVRISPPPLVFSVPPEVVVIPETYAYFSPGVAVDLFFCQGYWYRPYQGYWYRSVSYNGPWVYIDVPRVPYSLIHLPPDYRARAGYRHIPYRELRGNWRRWERDKYWERVYWGRPEHERERERYQGVAPRFGGERGERERHDSGGDRGRGR